MNWLVNSVNNMRCVQGSNALQPGSSSPVFRSKLLPPSAMSKSRSNKQPARSTWQSLHSHRCENLKSNIDTNNYVDDSRAMFWERNISFMYISLVDDFGINVITTKYINHHLKRSVVSNRRYEGAFPKLKSLFCYFKVN